MEAGKLREFITIQQKMQSGAGTRGQPVYEWTTFAQVYAEIEALPSAGKKTELARQLVSDASHTVNIRYLAGLTPQMRIVDSEGSTYQIGYVAKGQDSLRYFFHTLLVTQQINGI